MPEVSTLSLFSGIGGLDLAAEAAGIRTIAMCEKDAFCRSVLHRHWPDVPVYEDIFALSGKEVIGHGDSRKKITVIHGGFPCQ